MAGESVTGYRCEGHDTRAKRASRFERTAAVASLSEQEPLGPIRIRSTRAEVPARTFPRRTPNASVYEEILVPTDGSDPSTVAVEQAVALAGAVDARVHFLNVVDVGTEMSAAGVGTIADELTETFEDVAREALDDAMERADRAGVSAERTVREGAPYEVIGSYCEEEDVDLVVIGTTGRSGLTEHLLGSTTDRVAHTVDASVLIARR